MEQIVRETKNDDKILQDLGYVFDKTVSLLYELDDKDIFVPFSGKGGFSSSLYDGIMVGLSQNLGLYERNLEKLREQIDKLKKIYSEDANKEEKEKKYSGSQAHNPKKVISRINKANEMFSNI
jgi:hypothetical protein